VQELPDIEFAFPGPLRDALVAAVLAGAKTTTTGLHDEYETENEPLPQPGQHYRVIDSRGNAVAVIETVDVHITRLADVPLDHVIDEGEGHHSIATWRRAHETFWTSHDFTSSLGRPHFTVDDDTTVVLERFRLVRQP